MKNKGLGRGISIFMAGNSQNKLLQELSSNEKDKDNNPMNIDRKYIAEINITDILPNPNQPRKYFNQEKINELSESIKSKGILHPIILQKLDNDKYEIICGERRWRASKLAGLTTIPSIIVDYTPSLAYEVAIIENIQRSDLNPLEEALAFEYLIKEYNYTHDIIARGVNKSRSYITNILRLLNLPKDVQDLIIENKISSSHAKMLIGRDDASNLAKEIADNKLTIRQTEQLLNKNNTKKNNLSNNLQEKSCSINSSDNLSDDLRILEDNLKKNLSLDVKIKHNQIDNSGLITIRYDSLNEFNNIIQKLS